MYVMPLGKQEGGKSTGREGMGEGVLQGDEDVEEPGGEPRRYLTLRSVLRFSFQYPPLLFPVVQFQRVLRSKIIGKDVTCHNASLYACARMLNVSGMCRLCRPKHGKRKGRGYKAPR